VPEEFLPEFEELELERGRPTRRLPPPVFEFDEVELLRRRLLRVGGILL